MPVVAAVGAYVGSTAVAGTAFAGAVGSVAAGTIGGAIGGYIGGGVGAVISGGDWDDGARKGAIGGLVGGAIAGYSAGAGVANASTSAAEFAAADAAQLSAQGLSPSAVAQNLGYTGLSAGEIATTLQGIGIDYNTAMDAAASGNSYATDSMGTGLGNIYSNGVQTYGYTPPTIETNSLSSTYQEPFNALSQPGSFADTPTYGNPTLGRVDGGLEGIFSSSADKAVSDAWPNGYNLNEGVPYEVGAAKPSMESMSTVNTGAPILEGSTPNATFSQGTNNTTYGNNPVPTNLETLFRGTTGIMKEIMPKGMDIGQLGMAGYQAYNDLQNAKKLQTMADQAAIPYNEYMSTFSDPYKYWDEYMSGTGAQQYNKSARLLAKSGRTGTLPSLYTQGQQNYMANTLPQIRQGLAAGSGMASANMQQQAAPMAMKQRALSYIPSVMTTNKLINLYGQKK